ncbi:MAG: hypothetical protein R3E90_14015 [Marinicella sp.]|nr:hypothetical protein [Xanthomonadales bacterium]
MQQFVKNLIAAAILFISLVTTLAFGYAITPSNDMAQKPASNTVLKITDDTRKTHMIVSHTLQLLIPKVND